MDTNSPTAPEVTVNSTLAPIAPTEAQVRFLNSLIEELGQYTTTDEIEKLREGYREMYRARVLTKGTISGELDKMRDLVQVARERAAKLGHEVAPQGAQQPSDDHPIFLVPAGRYAVTGNEGQTVFVHVVKYGSGAFIVKQQISDDSVRMPKAVARTMLQKILDAGIQEASTRYGREIGECGVCGRKLTNEDSRQQGIGPVCRARLAG